MKKVFQLQTAILQKIGIDHTYNGFISRISPNGKIVWHRLFKVVNDEPLVPVKEFGSFLNSTIWNLHELDDGRIITGGTAYHNSIQNGVIPLCKVHLNPF